MNAVPEDSWAVGVSEGPTYLILSRPQLHLFCTKSKPVADPKASQEAARAGGGAMSVACCLDGGGLNGPLLTRGTKLCLLDSRVWGYLRAPATVHDADPLLEID